MTKTILIADDELYLLALLEQTLEPLTETYGVDIVLAHNGEDALALTALHSPDLIVLDMMMPKLDGLEVIARLRASPQTKNTPIIMLTARGQQADRERGLEVGATYYITKPFDPDSVLAMAQAALGL
jgi:two-component system, OmpR family, alkaline phosphatase synthesis response regulator PhoP